MSAAKEAGDRGEAETADYLCKSGYTVLARQWRCRFGEIDLIARDRDGTLCFVEVKLRSNLMLGLPREYVNVRKQGKLRMTAACYLSEQELDVPARFDVAEVYVDAAKNVARLDYLENAFT